MQAVGGTRPQRLHARAPCRVAAGRLRAVSLGAHAGALQEFEGQQAGVRSPRHGQQPAAAAAGLRTVTEVSRDRVVDACGIRNVSCAPAGGWAFANGIRCLLYLNVIRCL